MLVRSGIQNIRLIDFDQVTLSSLNRHAVATRADVGWPKVGPFNSSKSLVLSHIVTIFCLRAQVEVMKKHLLASCPHAQIDIHNVLLSSSNVSELLGGE